MLQNQQSRRGSRNRQPSRAAGCGKKTHQKKTAAVQLERTGSLFDVEERTHRDIGFQRERTDAGDAERKRIPANTDVQSQTAKDFYTDKTSVMHAGNAGEVRVHRSRGKYAGRSRREMSAGYTSDAEKLHKYRSRRKNAYLDWTPGSRDICTDNLKGILILLVVAGHLLLPVEKTSLVRGLTDAIYSFHMPCFILLSGFYAKRAMQFGRFRWGKLVQFLWLYLIFELLVNITEGMLHGEILLWPDLLHESGAPWYLLALCFWYALIPIFSKAEGCGAAPKALIVCVLTLLIVFVKYLIHARDFLSIDRVLSFAPFFFAGYFWSELGMRQFERSKLRLVFALLLIPLLTAVFRLLPGVLAPWHLVFYGADYHRYSPALWNSIWIANLCWYVLAFVLSLGVLGITPRRELPLLTALGQRTLQVYILHRPLRDLLQYTGFYNRLNPGNMTELVLLLASGVLLSFLLASKPVSHMTKWIFHAPDILLKKLDAI